MKMNQNGRWVGSVSVGWVAMSALLVAGCILPKDLGMLDTDGDNMSAGGSGGSSEEGSSDEGMGSESGGEETGGHSEPAPSSKVDILFVVDNSGSMGAEQGRLAGPMAALTEPLMEAGVSFRVAVTTSDDGNPWCTGTTPERGAMRMSSCQARQSEFIFEGASEVDATQEGCLDVCTLPELSIAPTTTDFDPVPAPRPWVEWAGPMQNNTPGEAPSDVLACALPQGINGCGFERTLESMYRALTLSFNASEPEFGFMRNDANLLVVFVTDEADCSGSEDGEIIFLPDGGRTFWSLKDEGAPTSAVCWNAGVQCEGDPSLYDSCVPADLQADGSAAESPLDAVLYPVSRYIGQLKGIQAQKRAGRVRTMAFVGRSSDDGPFVYADGADGQFRDSFGIGPGCSTEGVEAVPPVRLRAVHNALSDAPDEGLYSICNADYAPALRRMAAEIISWGP